MPQDPDAPSAKPSNNEYQQPLAIASLAAVCGFCYIYYYRGNVTDALTVSGIAFVVLFWIVLRGNTLKKQREAQVSLSDKHPDEVRAHVEKLFGVAEERSFRKIITAAPGISVHVIKPTSPQGFLTLFTTGLSAKPMKVPPELAEHAFAELYMQLPGDWDFQSADPRYSWPVQLLLDLAAYPGENDAYFAVPVTTIANGEPAKPLGPNVNFTASALLADEGFQRSDGKTVHLFCVMPIYAEEAEMARRFIPDFLKALDASGTSRILSLNRPNIAK